MDIFYNYYNDFYQFSYELYFYLSSISWKSKLLQGTIIKDLSFCLSSFYDHVLLFNFIFIRRKIYFIFITTILVDLLLITIYSFFLEDKHPSLIIIFILCIITNALTIIPSHFFWLKNTETLLHISISSFVMDIYLTVITLLFENILVIFIIIMKMKQ